MLERDENSPLKFSSDCTLLSCVVVYKIPLTNAADDINFSFDCKEMWAGVRKDNRRNKYSDFRNVPLCCTSTK